MHHIAGEVRPGMIPQGPPPYDKTTPPRGRSLPTRGREARSCASWWRVFSWEIILDICAPCVDGVVSVRVDVPPPLRCLAMAQITRRVFTPCPCLSCTPRCVASTRPRPRPSCSRRPARTSLRAPPPASAGGVTGAGSGHGSGARQRPSPAATAVAARALRAPAFHAGGARCARTSPVPPRPPAPFPPPLLLPPAVRARQRGWCQPPAGSRHAARRAAACGRRGAPPRRDEGSGPSDIHTPCGLPWRKAVGSCPPPPLQGGKARRMGSPVRAVPRGCCPAGRGAARGNLLGPAAQRGGAGPPPPFFLFCSFLFVHAPAIRPGTPRRPLCGTPLGHSRWSTPAVWCSSTRRPATGAASPARCVCRGLRHPPPRPPPGSSRGDDQQAAGRWKEAAVLPAVVQHPAVRLRPSRGRRGGKEGGGPAAAAAIDGATAGCGGRMGGGAGAGG